MALRSLVRRVLGLFGYAAVPIASFNDATARSNEILESALMKELIERHHIDCVLDIGANEGQFGRVLRAAGYNGAILSVEPNSQVCEALLQRVSEDSNWSVMQAAAGSEKGRMSLQVPDVSVLGSFYESASSWKIVRQEEVEVLRLDALKVAGDHLLLKTDTQGHDLKVLEGAEGLMERVAIVHVELSVVPLYKETPDWLTTVRWLAARDFLPVAFLPNVRQSGRSETVEFDGIFVRAGLG